MRSQKISPVEIVDTLLERAADCEARAQCVRAPRRGWSSRTGARRRSRGSARRRAGSAARRAGHDQEQHRCGGMSLPGGFCCFARIMCRNATRRWSRDCEAAGAIILGNTNTPGIPDGVRKQQSADGKNEQSLGSRAHCGRLQWRRSGRDRFGMLDRRRRQRWRRIDSRSRALLWHLRTEANARDAFRLRDIFLPAQVRFLGSASSDRWRARSPTCALYLK